METENRILSTTETDIGNKMMEDKSDRKAIKRILRQNSFYSILTSFVGLVFVACAAGIFISAHRGSVWRNAGATIFMMFFVLAFLSFGVFCIVFALKRIVPYFIGLQILKDGVYHTATIHSYDVSHSRSGSDLRYRPLEYDKNYSITMNYKVNGKDCLYKTPYIYTKRQLDYLLDQPQFGIKYRKNKAVIVEKFPPLPREPRWSELSKPIRKKAAVVQCFVYLDLILLIAGIVVFCLAKIRGILIAGAIALPIVAVLKGYVIHKVKQEKKEIIKRENPSEK